MFSSSFFTASGLLVPDMIYQTTIQFGRRKRTPARSAPSGDRQLPQSASGPSSARLLGSAGLGPAWTTNPQRTRAPPAAFSQLSRLLSEAPPPRSPRPARLQRLWPRSPQGGQVPPAAAGSGRTVRQQPTWQNLRRWPPKPSRLADAISRVAHNSERGRDTSAALPGTAATAPAAANWGGEPQAGRGQGRGHVWGSVGSRRGCFPQLDFGTR